MRTTTKQGASVMRRTQSARRTRAIAMGIGFGVGALVGPLAAQADTLYLCKAYSGGTFWSNGQCSQRQALIERIVTVPDGMPFDQQVNLAQQSRQQAERLTAPPPRATTTYTYNNGPDKATECRSLRSQIDAFDAQARQPQSGQMQDWISAQKKKARERWFRVGC